MDAREQLRRYLEQRREMGESELVLDSLTVEEALRIVSGAADQRPAPSAAPQGVPQTAPARQSGPPAASADWREMLRAAGGEPQPREPGARRPLVPAAPEQSSPTRKADSPPLLVSTPREPLADAPPGITVGSDAHELFGGPFAHLGSVDEIARIVHDCRRCPLFATATQAVPGEGPAHAEVMIVGEAPGANEDATGRPFVGAAGQLLTKILSAVNLRREDVFICNVMKHRPPGNRNPTPDEVAACSPYLVRQIELIKPKVILALGTFAAQTLLATKLPIAKLRGQLHRYHRVPLIVTYHPAALLRNPGWKRPTWEDVQLARRVLDRAAAGA
ncbi:MAG: uracil-DNA glycosylase family protein [Gemmatimonadaceae bacterium]